MNWLLIFAMFSPDYRSLEYRAFETEQECQQASKASVEGTQSRLGPQVWVTAECINILKLVQDKGA